MEIIYNLQKTGKRILGDLKNVRLEICDRLFKLHFDALSKDIDNLEKLLICDAIDYYSTRDEFDALRTVFVGKYTVVTFDYDDGWFCNVSTDKNNPIIISQCESINKFCQEMLESIPK